MDELKLGDNYLITTNNYFFAPDGRQYLAVFGKVHKIMTAEATLGVKTNAHSTNWYVLIGNMLIAGCQIYYVVRTDKVNFNEIDDQTWGENGDHKFRRGSLIYNANEGEQS